MTDGLRFGPLDTHAVHLCVDMQRLFADDTPWRTPWMERVLPRVLEIARAQAARTVFTRFVPAQAPQRTHGAWRRYWERWHMITLSELDPGLIELIPALGALALPERVIDKHLYSPWLESALPDLLDDMGCKTLVLTGGETDVCVLATALGAIDRGYRVILVTDALCSSSDQTHDALLTLYRRRYTQQVETVTTAELLGQWPAANA